MILFNWLKRSDVGTDQNSEPELIIREEAHLPLHVLANDAELSIDNGMFRIDAPEEQHSVRLDEISLVALHGGARVTVPCLHTLARNSIPLVLLSMNGYYIGQMTDLSANHAATKRAQYAVAANNRKSLQIARQLVEGKIRNAARIAKRRLGARSRVVRSLNRAAKSAHRSKSAASLRGTEGAAAAAWYAAWPQFMPHTEDMFVFDGRSRRPAMNATNSILSYLYAVITGTAAASANSAGLDPNVGFYHVERAGRPALALDLVEPLRHAVVDTAVISAIKNGEFSRSSFEIQSDGSFRLSLDGRKRALNVLERRLSTSFVYDGTEMTWRVAINHCAGLLAKSLRSGGLTVPTPLPR